MKRIKRLFCLALYYGFAQYLPDSYGPIKPIANASNSIRVFLVKRIFKKCGKIRTINQKAYFASGKDVEMGDNSGLGARCHIPDNTIIGSNVMVGRDSLILWDNHRFDRIDIPINEQGYYPRVPTVIEDDCWIGLRSLITVGRHISRGTIVAMGSVVTKDFPEYSIIGGNPAKLIKSRLPNIDKSQMVEKK